MSASPSPTCVGGGSAASRSTPACFVADRNVSCSWPQQSSRSNASATAKRLAEFLQSAAVDEQIMTQRMRDAEHSSARAAGSCPSLVYEAASREEEVRLDRAEDAVVENTVYPVHPVL